MKIADMLAELEEHGHTSNAKGPIAWRTPTGKLKHQPTSVLRGMLQYARERTDAIQAGSGPCPEHPDLIEGVCPRCRGIWPSDPTEDDEDPEEGK